LSRSWRTASPHFLRIAIAHAKAAVDGGAFGSMAEGLLVEAHESDLAVASEVTQAARSAQALKVGAENL